MKKHFGLLLLALCLFVFGQANQEVRLLEPGKPLEREIAGGEAHSYQIQLVAGQFACFRLEQRAIDAALILTAPDGKQLLEMNLTGAGGEESLSLEAATAGVYRLMVRGSGSATLGGAYRLTAAIKDSASAQDRKRLAAETLMLEANDLARQGAKTAPQVIEKLEQARTLWRELSEAPWMGWSLNKIGRAYDRLNRSEKAMEYFEQALVISREIRDRHGEAQALDDLGNALAHLSQNKKAIEYFEQALAISRDLNDRQSVGRTLNNLGGAHNDLGRPEKAIEFFEQALAISRQVSDRGEERDALNKLGVAYRRMGRYEKAIEYAEQALPLARAEGDRRGEAKSLDDLGNVCNELGQYEKAIQFYQQALEINREVKDRRREGKTLNNLGGAHNDLGRPEKAIEFFEQALAISREVKDRGEEREALNKLGVAYRRMGRYEKAIEYIEQALPLARAEGDRRGEAKSLDDLGNACNELGQYEKAIQSYRQALEINREMKDRRREGKALNSMGDSHSNLNQYEVAIECYEKALVILREVKDRKTEGMTLNNLGVLNARLTRQAKAIEYYEQALAINREVKDRRTEGLALNNLGDANRSFRRLTEAVSYHEQALFIAREVNSQEGVASALNNLMLDWKARSQPSLAIYFGKQSVNAYQEIRSNLRALDTEWQRSFLKTREQTYRDLADLLIAQGRLPEAEQVIRMLKEEEYFEFIRRDENSSPQAVKAALTPEEEAIEKRYREIADRIAELGSERGTLIDKKTRTSEEEQRLAKIDADLVVVGTAFQKFLDGLTTEMGKNAESNARAYQLRESQGLMEDLRELGKGVVALYTLVGEDKYRVILTTADFQKGYEYPIKAADLNRKVLEFRDILQNPKYDPLPLAQELYKILVAPVAEDLAKAKASTLMWSLDGVLRYLPVAALNDGKQYLIEQYRNVVFTPASQARLKDLPSRQWNALGLGVTKSFGERIPALPGVAEEMRGIIREAGQSDGNRAPRGVLPGTIKLDEQFTQEAMLAGLRQRPPVVHIASHFQFSPGNETNSALLLGDGKFLSLAQIKSLPNIFGGVELLTLSACNTATGGGGANGKEVEGFGVLAQRQGAKAVVASLWPVADRSTKHLMQEFYRLREVNAGATKAEALRQAQIKLLRGTLQAQGENAAAREIVHEADKNANRPLFKVDPKAPYAHPYYWAPFILIGNWR